MDWLQYYVAFLLRSFSSVLCIEIFSGSIVENFFSYLFQEFLFLSIKMQSSMVLWAMVNSWSISIAVKILNTHSTGLFEEGMVIASSANKQIFRNSLRWCTKISSYISWYSRWMMLWLLFEVIAIQYILFILQNLQL